jgi:uncharacterized protein YlxW (UPF0749 family)
MTKPPSERTLVAELVELVLNPQDPGYRAAAERRGEHARPRWYDRPLVALGCLLIGFVLVVAYVHTHRGAPEAAKVHEGLVTRVRAAQQHGDQLASNARQLNQQLSNLRDKELAKGSLSSELAREQLLAGRTAVTGPGLQVVLREPATPTPSAQPGRVGTEPIGASHILTDRDVRSVVNQLWADGAEAISVNDVRLTPTSAIRFAGEVVLVDLVPVTSPYTIRAIGPPDTLATGFAGSAVASRYQTLVSADGIGFSFKERDTLKLPASAGGATGVASPAPATESPR